MCIRDRFALELAQRQFPGLQRGGKQPHLPGQHPVDQGQALLHVRRPIQWLQGNEAQNTYGSRAQWTFANTQTAGFNSAGTLQSTLGNSYASYLLGAVSSALVNDDWVEGVGARFRTYSWWVQDNFRVTSRLSLNLGLRHEIGTNWVEVRDRMSWLDPNLPNPAIGGFKGALAFAGNGPNGSGTRNGNVPVYMRNFQPRIGLAYS